MSANYPVLTGVWENHSNTGLYSKSLTLDVRTGALLIASLATFITIVSARFWAIVAFAFHQFRTSSNERDGIHYQHQAIYRNQSTQLGVVWMLFRVFWAWRGLGRRNAIRLFAFGLPPLLCFAAFIAAGVLSARVAAPTYAASEVLVRPENCGFIAFHNPGDPLYNVPINTPLYGRYVLGKTREANNYARTCSGGGNSALTGCNVFLSRELPYKTRIDAPCPFTGDRCILGQDGAFELETSWIDSHRHLGINAIPADRIRLRRVTTCSVLRLDDLISSYQSIGTNVFRYKLGILGPLGKGGEPSSNYTFQYAETASKDGFGYSIQSDKSKAMDPFHSLGWDPMPDLNRTDADVSIFYFNTNTLRYTVPVYDPFFRATQPVSIGQNITYYGADNLTSIMACTDQFQIQNPNTNKATQLTSGYGAYVQAFDAAIGLNLAQSATVNRLELTSYDVLLFNSVTGLGAASLLAQEDAYVIISPGLPDDQWRAEVKGWFNASLATLQDRVVSFASKSMDGLDKIATLVAPGSDVPKLRDMCKGQIVRNVGAYQTFSVLGIGIIVGVGLFIIFLSLCLEPALNWLQQRFGRAGTSRWLADSVLHWQSMALRGEGLGGEWSKLDGEVPVTAHGEDFKVPEDRTVVIESEKIKRDGENRRQAEPDA